MKTKQLLTLNIALFALVLATSAQKYVTTLQHNGVAQAFYGQNSLIEAYNASVKGDTLNLSGGYFNAPTAFAKGITVIGSGHFPDPTGVVEKRTKILSGLTINFGADSLRLEGLYIDGDINYAAASSINYVKVIRCRLASARFNSNSELASKNYCSFEECFIEGGINFNNYGINLYVYHSIIKSTPIILDNWYETSVSNINGSAQIDGNIFIPISSVAFGNVIGSLINNNIIITQYFLFRGFDSNTLINNLFIQSTVNFGTNSYSNNYLGVPQADIFVNETGNAIDYTHDYHLKNPEKYIGTDGTQVGLYGGTIPFKEKGLPTNPQITSKHIASETDVNGNLDVNITVKAQAN